MRVCDLLHELPGERVKPSYNSNELIGINADFHWTVMREMVSIGCAQNLP